MAKAKSTANTETTNEDTPTTNPESEQQSYKATRLLNHGKAEFKKGDIVTGATLRYLRSLDSWEDYLEEA